VVVGAPPGWWLGRRLKPRDLLIVIYLVWAVALILAAIAFSFPDHD
jgi:predicted MFS family arabinose efflux permease